MLIGSHVGMSGKEMLLGSVKEAVSYGANTFMVYTGAPQNTKRKDISQLWIPEANAYAKEHGIESFVVHAPYIINLANAVKPETFEIAVRFLELELARTEAMGSDVLVLHPGSHVGEGVDVGIAQIVKGINEVVTADTKVKIALETMAGKGSEIGRSFEELAMIYEGVKYPEKLRVCFDTCHTNDAGYDLIHDWEGVLTQFDKVLGLDQIAVVHLNDSKNDRGAGKDRHENAGFGKIGFETLHKIASCKELATVPKILESPWVKDLENDKISYAPYKQEIAMYRRGIFRPDLLEEIRREGSR